MQFLEWLDRHFASNCHYYYADDLGCPLVLFPDPNGEPGTDTVVEPPVQSEAIASPERSSWQ